MEAKRKDKEYKQVLDVLAADFTVTKNLYLNEHLADVFFICRSDDEIERIPANKLLLAVTSPVFEKMFFGPMRETGDVEIVDADAEAFKEFLKFFYFRKVKLIMENMKVVFHLVEKYDIWIRATEACIVQLTLDTSKGPDDPEEYHVYIYQMFIYLRATEELEKRNVSTQESSDLFSSKIFKRLDQETLKYILELNFKCKEVNVFNAILNWAKYACQSCGLSINGENLKNQLGDCLKSIRYKRMTIQEFTNLALSNPGLFALEEFQDITFMLTTRDYKPIIFDSNPRWDPDNVLKCVRKPIPKKKEKHPFHKTEIVRFSSNQSILLGEIHAENIDIDCCMIDMSVIISEITGTNQTKKELYSNIHRYFRKFVFEDRDSYPMKILVPKTILIQAEIQYEIRVCVLVDLTETITTEHTWEPIVEMGDNFHIEVHRDSSLNYDNSKSGWISRLDFNKLE